MNLFLNTNWKKKTRCESSVKLEDLLWNKLSKIQKTCKISDFHIISLGYVAIYIELRLMKRIIYSIYIAYIAFILHIIYKGEKRSERKYLITLGNRRLMENKLKIRLIFKNNYDLKTENFSYFKYLLNYLFCVFRNLILTLVQAWTWNK